MNIELYDKIENDFKGGDNMAVLAKDKVFSVSVKEVNAKKFIEETNKNKISEEFLQKCIKSAQLFKGKR